MGPRLDSRGRVGRVWIQGAADQDSMGPRLDSRGRVGAFFSFLERRSASMGPRLDSRGRLRLRCISALGLVLQWGRGWTAAEGGGIAIPLCLADGIASMGPRLDSRGRNEDPVH